MAAGKVGGVQEHRVQPGQLDLGKHGDRYVQCCYGGGGGGGGNYLKHSLVLAECCTGKFGT